MTIDEGVIKFSAEHSDGPAPLGNFAALLGWRRVLYRLHLIGRDPARYGGAGFGNLSQRSALGFVVSGTQTGGVEVLTRAQLCEVRAFDPQRNWVKSVGPVLPSSEAMTHGTIYAVASRVNVVLHVHSPEIWNSAGRLGLAQTPADVPYGTQAMADAIERLLREQPSTNVVSMAGHEDGVLSFGQTADEAGAAMLSAYAAALSKRQ